MTDANLAPDPSQGSLYGFVPVGGLVPIISTNNDFLPAPMGDEKIGKVWYFADEDLSTQLGDWINLNPRYEIPDIIFSLLKEHHAKNGKKQFEHPVIRSMLPPSAAHSEPIVTPGDKDAHAMPPLTLSEPISEMTGTDNVFTVRGITGSTDDFESGVPKMRYLRKRTWSNFKIRWALRAK